LYQHPKDDETAAEKMKGVKDKRT